MWVLFVFYAVKYRMMDRFIVFFDLFSTAVQPAGMLYVVYIIYSTVWDTYDLLDYR